MSQDNDKNKKVTVLKDSYDGIIEHNHPLPKWWVATFILTIIFAVFYYGYYELLGGPSSDQELQSELSVLTDLQKNSQGDSFANLSESIKNPDTINQGKAIFAEKCFMCHGDKGQGTIGPNLTDNFWLHGNKPEDLLLVIQKGVPDKGMVPWEAVLSPEDQIAAVAFIKSLKGTNPPNPKASQGIEYKDE